MKGILKLHPTLNFEAKKESRVKKLNVENESVTQNSKETERCRPILREKKIYAN